MLAKKISLQPAILRHPVMSGDLRQMLDEGHPAAVIIPDDEQEKFAADVPVEEWQLDTLTLPFGSRTITVLAPKHGDQDVAYHAEYWPTPERERRGLSRNDWDDCAPSPNPGLLAYYVSEGLTAISIPLMAKEGVRHNSYRRLFVEINEAPDWLQPAHYHNNPGCSLGVERRLVEQMRRAMR